jgi:hypothetical protein
MEAGMFHQHYFSPDVFFLSWACHCVVFVLRRIHAIIPHMQQVLSCQQAERNHFGVLHGCKADHVRLMHTILLVH